MTRLLTRLLSSRLPIRLLSARQPIRLHVGQPGLQNRGSRVYRGNALALQPSRDIEEISFPGNAKRRAARQRQEYVPQQRVEGKGDQLGYPVTRAESKSLPLPSQEVAQALVAAQNGFGLTGAARGKENVGRVFVAG